MSCAVQTTQTLKRSVFDETPCGMRVGSDGEGAKVAEANGLQDADGALLYTYVMGADGNGAKVSEAEGLKDTNGSLFYEYVKTCENSAKARKKSPNKIGDKKGLHVHENLCTSFTYSISSSVHEPCAPSLVIGPARRPLWSNTLLQFREGILLHEFPEVCRN